jgi:DNA-binding GntR family transcriptional regulator
MQESETANDWEAVSRYDLEFHTALVAATGSERLQRMFSTVISETHLCLGVLTAAEARSDLVEEHHQIAGLIREGRTEEALSVLQEHFDGAIVTIQERERGAEEKKE